ncbi:MAG: isochorismatase family protein [Vallitaleaceae bacterium]|nr:isochorismatase family protein [Vallitaleaceae bacterium]
MKKTALLIVDVQNGLINQTTSIYKSREILDNISSLEQKARLKDLPIVYIQHENNTLIAGNEAWDLHPILSPKKSDIFINKQKSCGFDDNNLKEQLLGLNVTDLVICGLVSHACVKMTCKGAADHGFEVTLASDAHSNWRDTAQEIIDQVNLEMNSIGIIIKTSTKIEF